MRLKIQAVARNSIGLLGAVVLIVGAPPQFGEGARRFPLRKPLLMPTRLLSPAEDHGRAVIAMNCAIALRIASLDQHVPPLAYFRDPPTESTLDKAAYATLGALTPRMED